MGTWFNPHLKFEFLLSVVKNIYKYIGTGKIVRIYRDWAFFLLIFFTAPGACQRLDIAGDLNKIETNMGHSY